MICQEKPYFSCRVVRECVCVRENLTYEGGNLYCLNDSEFHGVQPPSLSGVLAPEEEDISADPLGLLGGLGEGSSETSSDSDGKRHVWSTTPEGREKEARKRERERAERRSKELGPKLSANPAFRFGVAGDFPRQALSSPD